MDLRLQFRGKSWGAHLQLQRLTLSLEMRVEEADRALFSRNFLPRQLESRVLSPLESPRWKQEVTQGFLMHQREEAQGFLVQHQKRESTQAFLVHQKRSHLMNFAEHQQRSMA